MVRMAMFLFTGSESLSRPFRRLIKYFLATVLILLTPGQLLLSQEKSDLQAIERKAELFRNRIEYDSSLHYFQACKEGHQNRGSLRSAFSSELNMCDLYILKRNYDLALAGISKLSYDIEKNFPDDMDLKADYFQVKGSYMLSVGEMDSARLFLERSISLRESLHGKDDTLLHFAFNKMGNLYLAVSDYDSAYFWHQAALNVSLLKKDAANYLAASSYQNLAIAAQYKGDYHLAEKCYKRSLELKESLFSPRDPALAKICSNLGKLYTDLSRYDLALEYYDKAEELILLKYDRDNIQFASIYWNKGNVYTHKGDYIKSTNYLAKALSILEINYGETNKDVYKISLDLGFAYDKKGDKKNAIEYYHRAAEDKKNSGIIKIYRNLANLYQEIDELDSADKYYQLSIDHAKKIFKGNSYDLALCYQYYGEFLLKKKNDPQSYGLFSRASEILIQLFGYKNRDVSKVISLQSEYYILNSRYDLALVKIQEALIALLPDFNNNNTNVNPLTTNFKTDIYFQDELLLKAIIHYLLYKENNNLINLSASNDVLSIAIAVIEEIWKTVNEEESQILLINSSRHVFDLGVLVALELFDKTLEKRYLDEAFNFNEKGKSVILLNALRGLEAQASSPEIAKLSVNENFLTREIAAYNDYLIQEKQKKNPDEGKIKQWTDKIFDIRLRHDSLLNVYKNNHPEYFRLKYDYSVVRADSLLAILESDQAILEYYMSDSLVYGFLLTGGRTSARILGQSEDLKDKLAHFHTNFIKADFFNAGKKEFEELTGTSTALYKYLISPFEEEIKGKRLIIIPDGELGYLSFDLLLKEKPDSEVFGYNELSWLLRDHAISYSSSATIFYEQSRQIQPDLKGNLLAFAPSYNFDSRMRNLLLTDSALYNLNPLTGAKEEINSIAGLLPARKMFDDRATESCFKKYAGDYGILHLAMHTLIDNENPLYSKLVFTVPEDKSADDGLLNTYELFGLRLPGQLAVLSACNTGSGKLERGEGIISLARGFFYAGIPSVVMTLWEVEDRSSADLMTIFYQQLKEGYPTDIALQKAKLEYLETAGRLNAHPYFWAGYVGIGKMETIKFDSGSRLLKPIYIVLIIIMLLGIIFLFINRRVFFRKKCN